MNYRVELTIEEQEDLETLCPWQVGGGYVGPPEYCELEKDPDADYCKKHEQFEQAMSEYERQLNEEP